MILTKRQKLYLSKKLNNDDIKYIESLDELDEENYIIFLRKKLNSNEFCYFKNLDASLMGTNVQYYSKKHRMNDPIKQAIHTELLSLNYHANRCKTKRKYVKKDSIKPLEIIEKKVVITWD